MEKSQNSLGVPIAIVLAAVIIAGAIFFTSNNSPSITKGAPVAEWTAEVTNTGEHILGNPDAPLKLTEYSDTQCPFCRNFHATMGQLMNEYPEDIKWQYKHFPLDSIHPYARDEAEAAECIAEIEGEEAFWQYIDAMFITSPSATRYEKVALQMGIDANLLTSCIENDVFAGVVNDQYQEALALGVRGTPHTIIETEDDRSFVLNGAYPYDAVAITIEMILGGVDDEGINGFLGMLMEGSTPEEIQNYIEAVFPSALESIAI